jgi:hypothetical protein
LLSLFQGTRDLGHAREKRLPEGPLIVQFTGGVWNPFNASNGPLFQRARDA